MRCKSFIFSLTLLIASLFFTASSLSSRPQDSPENYNEQGLRFLASEKFEEAVKAFEAAINLKPDYAEAHYHLGEAFLGLGEVAKAIDSYKKAIRYKPDFALAYNGLGTAYGRSEYKKSIEAYRESIRLDPKAALTHYNLGVAYLYGEKKELAVAEYEVLKNLDPSLGQDLYNIIYQPATPVAANGTVKLNVVALDSRGVPIDGLTAANFTILEDNLPQNALVARQRDKAVYCLAVDSSGSLRPIFELVLKAAQQVVDAMPSQSQGILIRFVSYDKIENIQEFTSSKRRLDDAIDSLSVEGGQSAVLDAVYLSAQKLASYKFPERDVRRVLFLLTDGEERASFYSLDQVLDLLRRIDVQIFAISFSTGNDRTLNKHVPKKPLDLLRKLTSETGGTTFFPKSAVELKAAVNAMLDFVAREYTVEYKPVKPIEAGSRHSLSLTITPGSEHQNSIILSRPGYIVSPK